MKQRNIVVALILSFVTCGIYGIYWFVKMTDESNELLGDPTQTSGGVAFLLSLVTCGIYAIYWYYKMGKKMYEVHLKNNQPATDNSILYLILALIGLGIVNYCLIQSEINRYATC